MFSGQDQWLPPSSLRGKISSLLWGCVLTTPHRACWNDHTVVHGVKYCNKRCSPVTHCGPVSVPEDHQAPCRRCLRPGQICTGGEAHGTVGVKNAHFLLYVSALPESHCRRGELAS